MSMYWKSPKIVLGPVATGDYYYKREEIVNDIWAELDKGSFVLMAAPRRVGKTSVMKHLEKYPKENYRVIFKNVQSLKSEKEFYKTIYGLILSCLSKSSKLKNYFKKYIANKSISEVDLTGSFKIDSKEIDYLEEINVVISDIQKEGETVVLLIDELPEVLHNLNKNSKKEEAIGILKNLRSWRQEERFSKLKFVLAGSIGIHYVVNTIEGRSTDLNDLKKVSCHALDYDEANQYIDWATKDATVQYNQDLKKYLLAKIQYFIPYFLNIIFDEVDKKARKNNKIDITESDIDDAFNVSIKNNDHFEDWKKRLSDYLPAEDYTYANKILTHIAHKNKIPIQKIHDFAITYNKKDDFMDIIDELEKDGYIVENKKSYSFISPFLKEFWKRKNPINHE
ncbi:AAA-like domain-containing protein [Flavobacterium sp. CF108]|uniref:AAA family ATPase n=1 Tax=unclassified Flavobacterium TaxID=196869 RepID=UPI0008BEB8B5|nr:MULTISPECIES: AAA-like domain-containing protein [unclassified Flavobacterium]SEN93386.1 ATPase [Flavobacterium sp. fv08]SHH27735.1 AAA-like domain-containing protein [Flavobacterium sp. CF108]